MEVTITLPDDVAQRLQAQWGDVSRRVLEDLVLDGYRARILGESDIRRLLGFETRFEVHDFLCEHQVPFYTLEDLQGFAISIAKFWGLSKFESPRVNTTSHLVSLITG